MTLRDLIMLSLEGHFSLDDELLVYNNGLEHGKEEADYWTAPLQYLNAHNPNQPSSTLLIGEKTPTFLNTKTNGVSASDRQSSASRSLRTLELLASLVAGQRRNRRRLRLPQESCNDR